MIWINILEISETNCSGTPCNTGPVYEREKTVLQQKSINSGHLFVSYDPALQLDACEPTRAFTPSAASNKEKASLSTKL